VVPCEWWKHLWTLWWWRVGLTVSTRPGPAYPISLLATGRPSCPLSPLQMFSSNLMLPSLVERSVPMYRLGLPCVPPTQEMIFIFLLVLTRSNGNNKQVHRDSTFLQPARQLQSWYSLQPQKGSWCSDLWQSRNLA
jgi:hypothetical protein